MKLCSLILVQIERSVRGNLLKLNPKPAQNEFKNGYEKEEETAEKETEGDSNLLNTLEKIKNGALDQEMILKIFKGEPNQYSRPHGIIRDNW